VISPTPVLDATKPVQLRNGRKARIICTDSKVYPAYPVMALVEDERGSETVNYRKADGTSGLTLSCHIDLINIPVVRKEYRGVLSDGVNTMTESDKALDFSSGWNTNCIGQFEYTFTDDCITDVKFIKRQY